MLKKKNFRFKFFFFLTSNPLFFYRIIFKKIPVYLINLLFCFNKKQLRLNKFRNITKKREYFLDILFKFNFFTILLIIFVFLNSLFVKKISITSNYQKITNNIFFATISFVIILIYTKQEVDLLKKIGKISSSILLNNFQTGIRGMFLNLFKSLDSSYNSIIENFKAKNSSIMIVDNLEVVLKCIEIFKKKNFSKIEFLCRKEINKILQENTSNFGIDYNNILIYIEFDQYDLNFLIFLIRKILSFKTNTFDSYVEKTELLNNYFYGKNNINDNLINQTITMMPINIPETKKNLNKENFLRKKDIITRLLNRKIKFTLNEKFFYKKLSEKLNINFFLLFTIYQKILKKVPIFFSLNLNNSVKICAFSIIFYCFYRFCFFQLIFFYSKTNLNKLKNSNKKQKSLLVHKIFRFLYIIQKKIKNFSKKNLIYCYNTKIKVSFFFSMILLMNQIFVSDIIMTFKYLSKKINNKLKKNVIFLENFENLKKNIFYFLEVFFNSVFSKKSKILSCSKKNKKINNQLNNLCLTRNFKSTMLKKLLNRKFIWEINNDITKKNYKIDFSIFLKKINKYELFEEKMLRIYKTINTNIKIDKISRNKSKLLQKRLRFVHKRYIFLKKKLIKIRYQQLLINNRLNKIHKKINKKFEIFVRKLSENVNLIYKELTQTLSNPLGGTALLNFISDKFMQFKNVIYTAIPLSKKSYEVRNLSGGEKTIASFALIIAINTIYKPPLIFTDEIDYNLDRWHSEKIMKFLLTWSEQTKIKLCVITLNLKFTILFQNFTFVFKNEKGSDFYNITF